MGLGLALENMMANCRYDPHNLLRSPKQAAQDMAIWSKFVCQGLIHNGHLGLVGTFRECEITPLQQGKSHGLEVVSGNVLDHAGDTIARTICPNPGIGILQGYVGITPEFPKGNGRGQTDSLDAWEGTQLFHQLSA